MQKRYLLAALTGLMLGSSSADAQEARLYSCSAQVRSQTDPRLSADLYFEVSNFGDTFHGAFGAFQIGLHETLPPERRSSTIRSEIGIRSIHEAATLNPGKRVWDPNSFTLALQEVRVRLPWVYDPLTGRVVDPDRVLLRLGSFAREVAIPTRALDIVLRNGAPRNSSEVQLTPSDVEALDRFVWLGSEEEATARLTFMTTSGRVISDFGFAVEPPSSRHAAMTLAKQRAIDRLESAECNSRRLPG